MSCNDKDIMKYLKVVFDVATELVFLEMRKDPKLAEEVKEITDEKIAEVKKTYDDAITEFVDAIFEYEAKLSKDDWISTVEEKGAWIINSSEIRAKFYPKWVERHFTGWMPRKQLWSPVITDEPKIWKEKMEILKRCNWFNNLNMDFD